MTRKCWTKWICLVMAVVLLFVAAPVSASGEGEDMEWTGKNSIVVGITVSEFKTFEPEDFPEINCKRVVMAHKSITEDGKIRFGLVLVLRDSGDAAVEKALEIARQDERLIDPKRNEEYTKCKDEVELNHSAITLKIGETVHLEVASAKGEGGFYQKIGVLFYINPDVIDNDTINESSFEQYGIHDFCPCNNWQSPGQRWIFFSEIRRCPGLLMAKNGRCVKPSIQNRVL